MHNFISKFCWLEKAIEIQQTRLTNTNNWNPLQIELLILTLRSHGSTPFNQKRCTYLTINVNSEHRYQIGISSNLFRVSFSVWCNIQWTKILLFLRRVILISHHPKFECLQFLVYRKNFRIYRFFDLPAFTVPHVEVKAGIFLLPFDNFIERYFQL